MATPPEVAPPFDFFFFIYILPTNRRVFLGFTIMANLNLAQVRDAVERKRRRDLGSLRSPMDIGQYGLNDPSNPYLQGIDKAGLLNMTLAREAKLGGPRGQARWNHPRPGPEDWRPDRELRVDTDIFQKYRDWSQEQRDKTITHEVGHLGEQALGNYRNWGGDVEDRSHNMIMGENVGGIFDPNNPYFGDIVRRRITELDDLRPEEHRDGISRPDIRKYKGTEDEVVIPGVNTTVRHDDGGMKWVDVDPLAAQDRLAQVNRQATSMMDQGLLGQDESSASHYHAPPSDEGESIGARAREMLDKILSPRTESGVQEDVRPTTLKQAQAQGKAHFWHDGKKKLAVTADQLAKFKKSDLYDADSKKSALSQWANIAQSEGGMKKLFQKKPDKQVASEVKETKADKQFLDDYMQNYYTGKKKDDPEFRENVKARLEGTVPDDHKKTVSNAISSAVKIFGTDKLASGGRMDKATMKKILQDLGQIESGYRTRIAGGGRPERGFWQVLPSTATDALKNAGAYFGPTFNKTFAGRDWVKSGQSPYESLKNMSQKEISKLLESDDTLGAAFSAVQVLRTFKKKK